MYGHGELDGVGRAMEIIFVGTILCCCSIGCSVGWICKNIYDRYYLNRNVINNNDIQAEEMVALQPNNVPNNNQYIPVNNDYNNEIGLAGDNTDMNLNPAN